MYDLLKHFRNEAGIRAAFGRNDPKALREILEQELVYYVPLCDRDHSSRDYVAMIKRVLSILGEDPHAEHAAKMAAALAALKKTE